MPETDLDMRRRLLLIVLGSLGVVMVLASVFIVSQQRGLLMENETKRAALEINLISEFISDAFLRRDYGMVNQFLLDWSEKRAHVVTLQAALKNGFVLADYQRKVPAAEVLSMERRLTFPNGNTLDLALGSDIGEIGHITGHLTGYLLGVFALMMAAFGGALWLLLNRSIVQPMQLKIAERTQTLNAVQSENLRMSAALDVTRKLQMMLLPSQPELTRITSLDIACFMEPASEVGGDYYDVLEKDGHIKIGIGDVTGHGLESGVLMLMVQMAVRTLLACNVTDPEAFLNILNRAVFDNMQRMNSDKNLSLSLVDYFEGKCRLSGQHEEVLVVRQNGQVERIDTLNLGFMVGMEPDISHLVSHLELALHPGDGLVLYTDGITEAMNCHRQQYGIERLCQLITEHWQANANTVRDAIIADLRVHIGAQPVLDDVTLLVIKQKA